MGVGAVVGPLNVVGASAAAGFCDIIFKDCDCCGGGGGGGGGRYELSRDENSGRATAVLNRRTGVATDPRLVHHGGHGSMLTHHIIVQYIS